MKEHLREYEQKYFERIMLGIRTNQNGANLERVQDLLDKIRQYGSIMFHKNIALAQRLAYNKHKTLEHLKNKIMIEVDFKQKVVIGYSPRQINSEYYNRKNNKRTILGIFKKNIYMILKNIRLLLYYIYIIILIF